MGEKRGNSTFFCPRQRGWHVSLTHAGGEATDLKGVAPFGLFSRLPRRLGPDRQSASGTAPLVHQIPYREQCQSTMSCFHYKSAALCRPGRPGFLYVGAKVCTAWQ